MENHTDLEKSNKALIKALCKAQGEFPDIKHNKINPHFRSSYADLSAIRKEIQPVLSKNGLALTQVLIKNGNTVLRTKLFHEEGAFVISDMPIDLTQSPQKVGSTITYYRRYALSAILGIATEDDDDGNLGTENNQKPMIQKSNFQSTQEEYVVPFGKFRGQRIEDLRREELIDYFDYLNKSTEPKNEIVSDFLQRVDRYLHD